MDLKISKSKFIEDSPIGPFLVLHLLYDVRDAMGANAVNTAVEKLAPRLEELTGGRVHLRILSNLADRRLARSELHHPSSINWRLMVSPVNRFGMGSLQPGHLLQSIPTVLPPTTRAS